MGNLVSVVTDLHRRTQRDYLARMKDEKIHCMGVAKKYDQQYWDGDRRYGYGGYRYDGRWEIVARRLVELYRLPANAGILDVGCGKGYLLYEFKKLLPECSIIGFDASEYALRGAKEEVKRSLCLGNAQDKYPYADKSFDLVISITTLHNLAVYDLKRALAQIERVGKNKYLVVESYRNDAELFNLQCWALTCQAFFSKSEWEWIFKEFGYTGDYEFIYFE